MGSDHIGLESIMHNVLRYLLVLATAFVTGGLAAQTVYKSVDDKGNVIYSETPPTKSRDGKIRSTKELSIDPNQNVLPAQKPLALPPPVNNQPGQDDTGGGSYADRVAEAKAALDSAEAQLKQGAEAQPGDFLGRSNGGVGPSSQRLERMEELQRAVDEARQKLESLRGESSQGE